MDERNGIARAEVVVGADGSAPALRAVAWAATEARLRGRALRIVHAAPYADTEPARRHALGILGRALTVARQQQRGVTATTELLSKHPAKALVETARGADLLVVGMVDEWAGDELVGSVATSVAAKAACPVTVVRGHQQSHTASLPVVLALADPAANRAAVEFAFADADRQSGTLVVLHVAHGAHGASDVTAALETGLQPWHDRYTAVPVEIRIEHGPVIEALLGGATRARMVVVGSHGRGAIASTVLGSASRALVKLSACPVTIVPRSLTAAEHAFAPAEPEAAR